jgi:hypothetical protein
VAPAHERAHGQAEPRAVELPLVVAVREEVDHLVPLSRRGPPRQHVRHGAIDGRVAAHRPLVRERRRVAQARQREPVLDPPRPLAVLRQPGDGADRAGRVQEPQRVPAAGARGQVARQERRHDQAREVVVGQRRVAHVSRDEDLVLQRPRQHQLAVGQAAGRERRIDDDLVLDIFRPGHRVQRALRETEAPRLVVVRRAVRDPVGPLGQRVQVRAQLGQRHALAHGRAVVDDVEVRGAEVYYAPAARVGDPGVAHVPLARHRPVEHLRAGRHLADLQRRDPRQRGQRLAHALPRDAAADRVQLAHERVHLAAQPREIGGAALSHRTSSRRSPRRCDRGLTGKRARRAM